MASTTAVPDMRLELVPLPVSDVDRAKAFYEQAGFGNLHDTESENLIRPKPVKRLFPECYPPRAWN